MTEKSKTHGRKITQLSKNAHELQKQSELLEAQGDHATALKLHEEAQEKEKEVMASLFNWAEYKIGFSIIAHSCTHWTYF